MCFGHDLDFNYDSVLKQIDEISAYAALHLPTDLTIPTVPDVPDVLEVSAVPDYFGDHSGDHASFSATVASASLAPHGAAPASFKLPQDVTFDFGNVKPVVVEKHGDNYTTVTETWDQHTDSHTGAGSSSWSFSSSSASADVFPKIESNAKA